MGPTTKAPRGSMHLTTDGETNRCGKKSGFRTSDPKKVTCGDCRYLLYMGRA